MIDVLFNGILTGSAYYALSSLSPGKYPFIYGASAIGLCHGLLGLYGNLIEGTTNSKEAEASSGSTVSQLHGITQSCMEYVTYPLVNIDLYNISKQSTSLALGHSLFVVPLAFDLSFKIFDVHGDGDTTETLKELTLLGNVVSLLFLAANEEKLPYALMALAAFCSRYVPLVMDSMLQGSGANTALLSYAAYFGLIPWAIAGASE